jgi:hypothetical protein
MELYVACCSRGSSTEEVLRGLTGTAASSGNGAAALGAGASLAAGLLELLLPLLLSPRAPCTKRHNIERGAVMATGSGPALLHGTWWRYATRPPCPRLPGRELRYLRVSWSLSACACSRHGKFVMRLRAVSRSLRACGRYGAPWALICNQ